MKNIQNYYSPKYKDPNYIEVEKNIYKKIDDFGNEEYVTSFNFVQEPDLGEGEDASRISQYPLEDILEKYTVAISDSYESLNTSDSKICYLEFSGWHIDEIKNLREIIGKHVYNIETNDEVKLVIEEENSKSDNSSNLEKGAYVIETDNTSSLSIDDESGKLNIVKPKKKSKTHNNKQQFFDDKKMSKKKKYI